MYRKLPEISILLPFIYSYLKLIEHPSLSDALIVGFLSLFSIALFFIRYKEDAQISRKPKELELLEFEHEKERMKISIEEMKYQANKNRIMRDSLEAGKPKSQKGFVF
jgi:hypothetical protein